MPRDIEVMHSMRMKPKPTGIRLKTQQYGVNATTPGSATAPRARIFDVNAWHRRRPALHEAPHQRSWPVCWTITCPRGPRHCPHRRVVLPNSSQHPWTISWECKLLEHTQQRLPQVLKPQTEYATFAYVEGGERPPIFLIQEGPLPSWSYRKRGLHDHQMARLVSIPLILRINW